MITNCGVPVEFDAHIAAGIRALELHYAPYPFDNASRDEARLNLYRLKQTIIEIP